MASKRGADINVGIKVGTTHGTAVACGAGDKLVLGIDGSLSWDFAPTILDHGGIGSGLSMKKATYAVGELPTVSINSFTCGYNNNFAEMLALFMGVSGAPTEVTTGEGDYKHVITYSSAVKKFATIASEMTDSATIEFPSCYPTSVTITTGDPNNFLKADFEFIANQKVLNSSTNTNATLANTTVLSESLIIHNQGDIFRINAQAGGALSSGDKANITSLTFTMTDAKEPTMEFKGSDSNGIPDRTELFSAQLVVTFKSLDDMTWFTAYTAGTEYKSDFDIQGSQIGAGTNETFKLLIPRMKVVNAPEYGLEEIGENDLTVTFDCLVASSNPTGMTSKYPYFEVTNTTTTSLLA